MSSLGDLEGWSKLIKQSGESERKIESDWFTNNPPLKEFRIQRGDLVDDYVQYGVWISGDDFLVFYKVLPTSKYSFRHRMIIEKEIVEALCPLLKGKENDTNKTSS